MKAQPSARAGASRQPAAARSASAGKSAGQSLLADNRPVASAQRKLARGIHSSPYIAAQRQRILGMFGDAVQRKGPPDKEELLQGRFDSIQRKAQDDEELQMKEAPPGNTGLPGCLRSGIESLSGMSMDGVKVHYDSSRPAQLNALAYAQGSDIHVAPGQERHLPHEAWHVVQQAQGRVKPTMQMKDGVPVNDDKGLEHEADVMGAKALANPAQRREPSTARSGRSPE